MNIYIATYHWNHNNVLGLELKGEKGKKKKKKAMSLYTVFAPLDKHYTVYRQKLRAM